MHSCVFSLLFVHSLCILSVPFSLYALSFLSLLPGEVYSLSILSLFVQHTPLCPYQAPDSSAHHSPLFNKQTQILSLHLIALCSLHPSPHPLLPSLTHTLLFLLSLPLSLLLLLPLFLPLYFPHLRFLSHLLCQHPSLLTLYLFPLFLLSLSIPPLSLLTLFLCPSLPLLCLRLFLPLLLPPTCKSVSKHKHTS